mmetsp:Transcript_16084/g.27159  ORF Transcript_16084/g.27159 Transcript_16084/m.27159 type:complete len:281 (+) Transcript_16084:220-1062(+)
MTNDDFLMNEDMVKYYTKAPVFSFSFPESEESDALQSSAKEFHKACFISKFNHGSEEERAASIAECFNKCEGLYKAKVDNEVSKIFTKFDYDKNNTIDKSELASLSKELGHELTAEELETAMKDLDMNGNGVIDFSEFKRWYFSGMKAYDGKTKTMLKIGRTTYSVLDVLKKHGMKSGNVSIKNHKFQVSFNNPANPGLSLSLEAFPVGPDYSAMLAEMESKYKETLGDFEALEDFKNFFGSSDYVNTTNYCELRIQMKSEAQPFADALSNYLLETFPKL